MANRRKKSGFRELVETVAIVVVLAFVIRTFVFESFQISGNSMQPTLFTGERVMVNKLAFDIGKPKTGEIIVFRSPQVPSQDWIKRVIGLPGETVSIRNNNVYINGKLYPEPFLKYRQSTNYGPETVPQGDLFVLGDNRPISDDSRIFGMLPQSRITGQAFVIWWPFNRLRWLP